jgi:arsenical pump membrane protein
LVLVIAAASILLLGIRPRAVPAWVWPSAGACVLLLLGREPLLAAGSAILRQWNVLLFILGLMGMAAAAEQSQAFEWLTEVVLLRGGGSRRRLFIYLFLVGAALTALLSNDATAIVLTPIVYRAVARRGGDATPFLFGSIFVADTASFGLPFSNPANVLILPHPRLLAYLWHLGPPELAAIALNLWIFLRFFRSELGGRYDLAHPSRPSERAIRTLYALGIVALAYVVALSISLPLGPVAAAGALLALGVARTNVGAAARHIGWGTFALLAAFFVLLDAVVRAGLGGWALNALHAAERHGALAANAAAAAGAALLSNLLNNLPVAVISSYFVEQARSLQIGYPLIAGVDLGPNLTMTGSLATILWLAILHERGVRVSVLEYVRLGSIVVPATISVTLLWLWLIG